MVGLRLEGVKVCFWFFCGWFCGWGVWDFFFLSNFTQTKQTKIAKKTGKKLPVSTYNKLFALAIEEKLIETTNETRECLLLMSDYLKSLSQILNAKRRYDVKRYICLIRVILVLFRVIMK